MARVRVAGLQNIGAESAAIKSQQAERRYAQRMRAPKAILWTVALAGLLAAQSADLATITRHGDFSTLSVHTFRPLDAVAITLEVHFGLAVSAEDPAFQFAGDMMDISPEVPRLRTGTLVPARWGFQVDFPVNADGSPRNTHELLRSIVAAANSQSPFMYRLDDDAASYSFVPTGTRDSQGRSIPATPLLDRPVTIPFGVRRLNESAALMGEDLSRQTGRRVHCCQSSVAGFPWGMDVIPFSATGDSARSVLKRMGLSHWHARCDMNFCFIDKT